MSADRLPDRIKMQTADAQITIAPSDEKEESRTVLSGLNPKKELIAEIGTTAESREERVFVKTEKFRSRHEIFPEFFNKEDKLQAGKEHISTEKIDQHLRDVQVLQNFNCVLAPLVGKAIFGDLVAVPENYFYIHEFGKRDQLPVVISVAMDGFTEFLSEAKTIKEKNPKTPSDWKDEKSRPMRTQLNLDVEKAEVLGVIYCYALLMGHWDVFNNINLSNSGFIRTGKELVTAIVDQGNQLGMGFGGVLADQTAAKNPAFAQAQEFLAGRLKLSSDNLTDCMHCLPFDENVYPILPRQLVRELFNLTGDDEISEAVFKGFEKALLFAMKNIDALDKLIPQAIESSLRQHTAVENQEFVRQLLSKDFYFPDEKQKNGHTLLNVMKGRLRSIQELYQALKHAKKEHQDAGKVFDAIALGRLHAAVSLQAGELNASPAMLFANAGKPSGTPSPTSVQEHKTKPTTGS
jgi:hypothetical protein